MTATEDIIRRHARPLESLPTAFPPKLRPLPDIRAVLFDVYGTLVISGCGDVGTVAAPPAEALAAACREVGLDVGEHLEACAALLVRHIEQNHAEAHATGIEHPEVDILAIWRRLLPDIQQRGWFEETPARNLLEKLDYDRLAVEYEMRANPVWTMPGAAACLARLAERSLSLGIVSNAQFFTPELLPVLLGAPLPELGFSPDLCVFSFLHCQAKPGTYLFERALEELARLQIAAPQVLYVGNDMRNDVMPAARLGMKTALFAGDDRSLRLRADDPRVQQTEPDLIVTELEQIVDCVTASN